MKNSWDKLNDYSMEISRKRSELKDLFKEEMKDFEESERVMKIVKLIEEYKEAKSFDSIIHTNYKKEDVIYMANKAKKLHEEIDNLI